MRALLLCVAIIILSTLPVGAAEVAIGYLSLEHDPRYDENRVYARIELAPRGDPLAGAKLGLEDAAMIAHAVGHTLRLDVRAADSASGLVAAVEDMVESGTRFVVLDLPGTMVDAVAAATAALPVTLINATAPEDALRASCHPHLLHTAASDRMAADAMAQYLRQRDWRQLLLLTGETPRDAAVVQSMREAAARLALVVVEERGFTLAADPANREANNLRLLTGGIDYDVVFIADSDGEFGRYLPYATHLPRPVVGTTGLVATAWHWSLERYGAPQVNARFEALADGRRMVAQDWATWIAVRAVVQAYARSGTEDPAAVAAYLRGERFHIDGSKGVRLSFRSWDGQMRMPILLATHNAVIAIPPLEGFLHHTNDLDTLGADAPEHRCS